MKNGLALVLKQRDVACSDDVFWGECTLTQGHVTDLLMFLANLELASWHRRHSISLSSFGSLAAVVL